MSEPNSEKYKFKPALPTVKAYTQEQIEKLMADSRWVALVEACRVTCGRCGNGEEVVRLVQYFWHPDPKTNHLEECDADKIRKLMETKK